jgi:NAD(P)-dependent dehydrogenase (short-subunit alcohol dehydrogenase family)
VLDMTVEEWDRVMETNMRLVFLTCRAAARSMKTGARAGQIITISSGAYASGRVGASHAQHSEGALIDGRSNTAGGEGSLNAVAVTTQTLPRTADLRCVLLGALAPVLFWKGLITQRLLVQIQPPQPAKIRGSATPPSPFFFLRPSLCAVLSADSISAAAIPRPLGTPRPDTGAGGQLAPTPWRAAQIAA